MGIFSKLFNRNKDKKEEQTDALSLSHCEGIEAMNESLRDKAYQMYTEENYDRTFLLFKTVAEEGGDLDTIFNLAMCYLSCTLKNVTKSDHTPEEFNKVCNVISEYGTPEKYTPASEAFFEEHTEMILKDNAIQVLSEM